MDGLVLSKGDKDRVVWVVIMWSVVVENEQRQRQAVAEPEGAIESGS